MWEKLKNDKTAKELLVKLVSILIIASIALLCFDVMTQSKDGRKQIIDSDGGTEYTQPTLATDEEKRLASILSAIKGVGECQVMVTYESQEPDAAETFSTMNQGDANSKSKVKGVIVTAKGAGNPVIQSKIIDAVTGLYKIPANSVMVYEENE